MCQVEERIKRVKGEINKIRRDGEEQNKSGGKDKINHRNTRNETREG
jgi:hypothetical protein